MASVLGLAAAWPWDDSPQTWLASMVALGMLALTLGFGWLASLCGSWATEAAAARPHARSTG